MAGRRSAEAKKIRLSTRQKTPNTSTPRRNYLQAKRILENMRRSTYSTASMLEEGIDFDPVKIWERAEPAASPRPPESRPPTWLWPPWSAW